jgi:glycine hydroxymethyltransferase
VSIYLKRYMSCTPEKERSLAAIASLASLDCLRAYSPLVAEKILQELQDQSSHLKMIASENYSSLPVQLAAGNWLTDKYAEGYPGHRFYSGCENIDAIENLAIDRVKALYGADHAYVQPHSGADANMIAYWSIIVQRVQNKELEKLSVKNVNTLTAEEYERIRQLMINQTIMGMALKAGGHLTHGYRMNMSSKMMRAVAYEVDPTTHLIDYQAILELGKKERPLIMVAGYSAYPRLINFAKMREIADAIGATLIVDMAHFSGLVAGKVMQGDFDPVPFAHIVTSTTHKTLRGPRGGMILCKEEFKEGIDKGCPLVIGGPIPQIVAAKAIAFEEAATDQFKLYARQIVKNAQAMAERLMQHGVKLTTNGTDNHLMVVDVWQSFQLSGLQAEKAISQAMMSANRNAVPFDAMSPWLTSGLRFGTSALTTRGLKEKEMRQIADFIYEILSNTRPSMNPEGGVSKSDALTDPAVLNRVKQEIALMLKEFPLYPELQSAYS